MNSFIKPGDTIVEIGAGAGLSREFIVEEIILTDVLPFPWMNVCGDALRLPFGIEKIDALICANVMHHVAAPVSFIAEMHRCLKPGGHVLIVEPNPSFLFLLALRIMRHEGWSFDIDVFNPAARVNDPADPWSGNNALSYLLFEDKKNFSARIKGFEVIYDYFSECLMLLLSGGVTAKTRTVELSTSILTAVDYIDGMLCRLLPMIFAMRRSVVLRKLG
ncbi:MAG: methyltransferase domain-containing protein [Stellaceae bacterium]